MARSRSYAERSLTKDDAALQEIGTSKLRAWCQSKHGRQAALAKALCIHVGNVSRMAGGRRKISLEHSIGIEVESRGELKAEELCPTKKELIQRFRASQYN